MSGRYDARPAFVIGTGRCGLSPLMDLIAYHPDFAWPTQYHDRWGASAPVTRLSRIVDWPLFRGHRKFAWQPYIPIHDEAWALWKRLYPGFPEPFRDLVADDVTPKSAEKIRTTLAAIVRDQGKERFLAEYSGWSRIGFMREVFPEAQFIHIMRDPRAVCNSLVNVDYWRGYQGTNRWRWGQPSDELRAVLEKHGYSFLAMAAVQWKMLMANLTARTSELTEDDVKLVRYEDMVASPHEVGRECVRFLGHDAENERFRAHLPTAKIVDANSTAFRIPSWRDNMTPKQIAMLEEILADELEALGYT